MTLHKGEPYHHQDVRLDRANVDEVLAFPASDDVKQERDNAIQLAQEADDAYYFSIYRSSELVGQIFLHDINCEPDTSLIGYHLFHPRFRGKGIGTKALHILKEFACHELKLKTLMIITGTDNGASRGIAEKNGFRDMDGAREDPDRLVVFQWSDEQREEE